MNRHDMNRQDAKIAKSAKREPDHLTDGLAQKVIGAAIEVHRHLGPGYLEGVYDEGLAIEFDLQGIPYERQKTIAVDYKGRDIGQGRLGFVVGGTLVVELKAVDSLLPIHTAQVISYLKASGCVLGLVINFNVPVLRKGIRRVVLS
jgi:GxxExxY protein